MDDAVSATDVHSYSRQAILHWFSIRKSSPLHGTPLEETSLNDDDITSQSASQWIDGGGVVSASAAGVHPQIQSLRICATWRSELATDNDSRSLSCWDTSLASVGVHDGQEITIRIADETSITQDTEPTNATAGDHVLVKLYRNTANIDVAYWTDKHITKTLTSALWKWWRHCFQRVPVQSLCHYTLWSEMTYSGNGISQGHPSEDPEARLVTLFNSTKCSGTLEEESVFHKSSRMSREPRVLKLSVQRSMSKSDEREHKLTRLDVLKQMFEALINRTLAYNFKTHVGLVTVSSTALLNMPISNVIENFRRATNLEADGDTALWDAIALCRDQLQHYATQHANARKRDKIALDIISLGNERNAELLAVSHVLKGYGFHPTSLANALAICEMEPLLSVTEKPEGQLYDFPNNWAFTQFFFNQSVRAGYTVANDDSFPRRKIHPSLHDSFIPLADAMRRPTTSQTAVTGTGARSNLRTSRLMNEMRQVVASGPHANYDVYVSEADISFWKVVMSGPSETSYEKGVFLLYVHAEERYRTFAPKARFVTRIKHPNVKAHGRIYHSILDRDWTTDTSTTALLDTVFGLLYQPEFTDPVNTTITLGYHHDQVEFGDEVRACVDEYASKNRSKWKDEILQGEDWHDDDESEDDADDDEHLGGDSEEDDEGEDGSDSDGSY